MNLLSLITRERTRRAENPGGEMSGPFAPVTDEDRVKALEAFLVRVRFGNLSANEQQRAKALLAFFRSCPGPGAAALAAALECSPAAA